MTPKRARKAPKPKAAAASRNRSAKAHGDGGDGVAGEEAGGNVLASVERQAIARPMTVQPMTVAASVRRKPRRKSTANRGMKAARSHGRKDVRSVLRDARKGMKAARSGRRVERNGMKAAGNVMAGNVLAESVLKAGRSTAGVPRRARQNLA